MHIAIVGPCASGKSTLAEALREDGHHVRTPGQEHSDISHLWRYKGTPDVLIYLDVSYEAASRRRSFISGAAFITRQQARLSEAYENADLYINTDETPRAEVLATARAFLADLT